jgi:D-xylose transport system substrate-binding protein
MTVYKSAVGEANALAELAISLINGEEAETTGTVEDGNRQVDAVLLDPVSITADNVDVVVEDGAIAAKDLCTGQYAAMCDKAGIS